MTENIVKENIALKIEEQEKYVVENGLRMNWDRTILYGAVSEDISKLEIPDNIVEIAAHAFEGTSSLTEVILNEGLRSIGEYAFGCTSIAKVKIPGTVESLGVCCFTQDDLYIEYFEPCHYAVMEVEPDSAVFRSDGTCIYKINRDRTEELLLCYVADIESYKISDTTVYIREKAFLGCSKLKNVVLGKQVKVIGKDAFSDCCLERMEIPESIKDITNVPFLTYWGENGGRHRIFLKIDAANPNYYNVGGTVYKRGIDGDTLLCCNSNDVAITVQEGTTIIGTRAFAECSELQTVILPNTIRIIETGAFRFCEELTSVVTAGKEHNGEKDAYFPDTLETIEDYAFMDCGIKKIEIPGTIKEIHKYAFSGCEITNIKED